MHPSDPHILSRPPPLNLPHPSTPHIPPPPPAITLLLLPPPGGAPATGGLATFLSKSWSKSRLFPSGNYFSPFSQTNSTGAVPGGGGAGVGMYRAGSHFSQAGLLKEGNNNNSNNNSNNNVAGSNKNNKQAAPAGGKVSLVVDTSPARARPGKGQGLDGAPSAQGKELALAPPLTVEAQGWALSRDERMRVLTVWDTAFMKVRQTLHILYISYNII